MFMAFIVLFACNKCDNYVQYNYSDCTQTRDLSLTWRIPPHAALTQNILHAVSHMAIFDLWPQSVTLTLEILTYFFRATHRPMMVNKCAKWFWNLPINKRVMARTRSFMAIFLPLTSKYDLDLGDIDVLLSHDTPSHEGEQIYQVILKYNDKWHSYGPDKLSV